jgi:hypothetical protein
MPDVTEDLNLLIYGLDRNQLVINRELLVDQNEISANFVVTDAKQIDFSARNVYEAPSNTFVVVIKEYKSPSKSRQFMAQITSIIVVFFCFLTLTSCVTLVVRMRRRSNHQRLILEQENAFAARHNMQVQQAR